MLLRVIGALALLAVVVAVVDALSHGAFLTAGNLTNVLRQITYNAILGIGQTFVIITAGIDLSVGSLIELTGVVMATFANNVPFHGPLLLGVTLLVGLAVGCFAGFVNAVPVVRLNLPPFITTLAMMLMARGLAFKLAHGQPVTLTDSTAFDATGTGFLFAPLLRPLGFPGIPVPVLWMIVLVVVFAVVLTRTRFGRYVFAIGGNEEAARLAGINVARVKTLVYVISGGCAAVAGLLLMARFGSGSPNTGIGSELQSIAAVVVGGTSLMGGRGSVVATFFGALLIGLLNNVMNLLNIESYTQDIVLGAVILVAVVVDELRKRYLRT
ncbi:MAG: ABC transporter permease [Candidatus Eremiobacteraeota bacterium]|nr:ABC transporter permease [Candidatus Eremiobacteraeota bacterium]MBC5804436.1 ABC transporter permease [Candidatus Eremiobacteraeota bacterium]MBC5821409.1 ABC transporter permease [Candidatus Eremiobacteraeota bacterium]